MTYSPVGPKVVVVGGGYAGLSCLIEMSKGYPRPELHLVDAGAEHCKLTCLHKSLSAPFSRFCVPYEELARRFRFEFHRHHLHFGPEDFAEWQRSKAIALGRKTLEFDYLVICTGAESLHLPGGKHVFGLADLRRGKGEEIVENFLERSFGERKRVTVVGGGATGIQVLFELRDLFRRKRSLHELRLVDFSTRLTPELPAGFHSYIERKLRDSGIEYLPRTKYLGQSGKKIRLENLRSGEAYPADSDLTLLFPGVSPAPEAIRANGYGQIELEDELCTELFVAGDCSLFRSRGLNRLTAQAAVRKGRIVARNIRNLSAGKPLREYRYREQGYVVGLGCNDGIGWVGLKCNLVKGLPAAGIKGALEFQYDLFLRGIDTYFDLPPNF